MSKLDELARANIFSIKPYVPGKPIEEVEREYGISGAIKLASNENPLGPSPAVLEAVRAAVPRIYNYPDGNCYYLKRELAHFYHLDENNFIIGNGADEVIKIIGEAFLETEDEVIYPWPTFSEYIFVTKLMGAKPIPCLLYTSNKGVKMRDVTDILNNLRKNLTGRESDALQQEFKEPSCKLCHDRGIILIDGERADVYKRQDQEKSLTQCLRFTSILCYVLHL